MNYFPVNNVLGSLASGGQALFFVLVGILLVRLSWSDPYQSIASRQALLARWKGLVETFVLQVHLDREDEAYDWLRQYFGIIPAMQQACRCSDCARREPSVHTRRAELTLIPGPRTDGAFTFRHGTIRIKVLPRRELRDSLAMYIRTYGYPSSRSVMAGIVRDARELCGRKTCKHVSVYLGKADSSWVHVESKIPRSWSTVILEENIKETVLTDATSFLSSRDIYYERSLPYRRGYLFHGPPGSGKTSLVQALAGALDLDIYIIPLGTTGFDNSSLDNLMSSLPPKCIALIEDIDCALPCHPSHPKESSTYSAFRDTPGGQVTLSGLINAIDGVTAHEGRLLVFTTNVPSSLDPALLRPGRIDISIEFKSASKQQAADLFRMFFPAERVYKGLQLTYEERNVLAQGFAEAIPDHELSMAALQVYLLTHKAEPWRCVQSAAGRVKEICQARLEGSGFTASCAESLSFNAG